MKTNKTFFFLLLLIFITTSGFSQVSDYPLAKYTLKITGDNLRLVDVRASMVIQDSYLEMDRWGIPPDIKGGWTEFIDIKSITDENGKSITYTWSDSLKQWQLKVAKNSQINLHYQVRLEHDNYDWDAAGGIDGRPTVWSDNTIFWVTKGLFIFCYGDDTPKKAEIIFDIPESWKVSTAWVKLSERKFFAKNLDELSSNLLMIGNHEERLIKLDNMSITIATPSNFSHRAQLIEQSLEKILPTYKGIFGELPTANYLVCASKNEIQDGEAFTNSFHQMFLDKDLEYNKIVWANTLAHEMFHYWNGTNFLYSNDYEGNYWFSEGFTNYYSSLTLLRTGIISQEDYLRWLAFQFARYNTSQILAKEKLSLEDAGKRKFDNWHFIYGGGSSVAFILDIEIRDITKGEKSLDDFMRALYSKYGKLGMPISLEIQIEELNYLTNTDFKPFFDKYITGTDPAFDVILSACEKAGLAVSYYQRDFYLNPKDDKKESIYQSIIKSQITE